MFAYWTSSCKLAPRFSSQVLWMRKCKFLKLSRNVTFVKSSKSHMTLRVWASHRKTVYCLVWCPEVSCKWRYNVFNLSHDLTWPYYWGVMEIYGWELLKVCPHLSKSCEHRHYNSGDIVFLICHVTSCEHMCKGLCDLMGGIPSWRVTNFPYLVTIGLMQVEIQSISREIAKPRDWRILKIFDWKLFMHGVSPSCQVWWA